MSKRKQNRPSKFDAHLCEEKNLIDSKEKNRSQSIIDDEISNGDRTTSPDLNSTDKYTDGSSTPNESISAHGVILAGTLFGPYKCAKEPGQVSSKTDNESRCFKVFDQGNGKQKFFLDDASNAQWLNQLKFVDDSNAANCVLEYDGNRCELVIKVVRDIATFEDLIVSSEKIGQSEDVETRDYSSLNNVVFENGEDQADHKGNEISNHYNKCFLCSYCETRFSHGKTLEAHQKFYCAKKPSAITDLKRESSDSVDSRQSPTNAKVECSVIKKRANSHNISSRVSSSRNIATAALPPITKPETTNPVILLPCAYSKTGVVQLLGKPHTVIPIAVPESWPESVAPLILEDAWCAGLDLTTNLPVGDGTFALPLKFRSTCSPASSPKIDSGQKIEPKSTNCKDHRRQSPLDLSKKSVSPRETVTSVIAATGSESQNTCTSPAMHSTPEPSSSSVSSHPKLFLCAKCGVAFSSRKTLDGHQTYYCKSVQSKSVDSKIHINPNTQILCCQYCEQTAATAWHLLQHMKTTHALGSAYLCTLCGYRGFSLRGMRSHLKHTHDQQILSDDEAAVSKFVKTSKLFDESGEEGENETVKNSKLQREVFSEITECSEYDLPPEKKAKRSTNGVVVSKRNTDRKTPSVQSLEDLTSNGQNEHNQSSLVVKYNCQFCAYKSPYKGNVKRHLALVHKNEYGAREKKGE